MLFKPTPGVAESPDEQLQNRGLSPEIRDVAQGDQIFHEKTKRVFCQQKPPRLVEFGGPLQILIAR